MNVFPPERRLTCPVLGSRQGSIEYLHRETADGRYRFDTELYVIWQVGTGILIPVHRKDACSGEMNGREGYSSECFKGEDAQKRIRR